MVDESSPPEPQPSPLTRFANALKSLVAHHPERPRQESQTAVLREKIAASLAGYVPPDLSLPELLDLKETLAVGTSVPALVLIVDLSGSSQAHSTLESLEPLPPKPGEKSLSSAVSLASLSALMNPEVIEKVAIKAGLKHPPLFGSNFTGDGLAIVIPLLETQTEQRLGRLSDLEIARFITTLAIEFTSLLSTSGTPRAEMAKPLAAAPAIFGSKDIPLGHRTAIAFGPVSFETTRQYGRKKNVSMIGPGLTVAARMISQSKDKFSPNSSPVMVDQHIANLIGIHSPPTFVADLSRDDLPDLPIHLLPTLGTHLSPEVTPPPTIAPPKKVPLPISPFTTEGVYELALALGIDLTTADIIANAKPGQRANLITAYLWALSDAASPNRQPGTDYVPPFFATGQKDIALLERAARVGSPPPTRVRLRKMIDGSKYIH